MIFIGFIWEIIEKKRSFTSPGWGFSQGTTIKKLKTWLKTKKRRCG